MTITNQQTKHHFHPIPRKNCALAFLSLRAKQHCVWTRASKLHKQGPNKSFSNERMQQNHCFIALVSYLLWLKHKETVYIHSCTWFRLKGYANTTATAMGAFTGLFKTTLKFKSRLHNCVFAAVNHNYDHNPSITNHKPWPFEPVEVNFCFLRGPLRWLTAAKSSNVSCLLNFRIRVPCCWKVQ